MELGDWGEMPSDEEKGGSKERKEKKKKVGVATRRTAFYLCTTIFIRSSVIFISYYNDQRIFDKTKISLSKIYFFTSYV